MKDSERGREIILYNYYIIRSVGRIGIKEVDVDLRCEIFSLLS